MAQRRTKQVVDSVTPENCWQVFSEMAQKSVRQWREGGLIREAHKSERSLARFLLTQFAFDYEKRIAGFVANGNEDAPRYVGQFWHGGQPRE